jgi:flagellar basal-body rod modification protein FlgD
MTVAPTSNTSAAARAAQGATGRDYSSLGQADFLRLLTVQLQQQDPTAPMDNSQMLAQMAQFTSLSNSTEMNSTLKAIATKLGVTGLDSST